MSTSILLSGSNINQRKTKYYCKNVDTTNDANIEAVRYRFMLCNMALLSFITVMADWEQYE